MRDLGIAYDTGPASALMDAAVSAPREGPLTAAAVAAAGEIHEGLLRDLLAEPYYRELPPKTTGKELFHPGYLARMASPYGLALPDLLATLTALRRDRGHGDSQAPAQETVVVSGGGVRIRS